MGIRSAGSGGSANSLPPACGSDHAGPCRSVRCVGTGPSPAPPASGRGDSMTITVLSGLMRPLVESRLPGWVEPRFVANKEEAMAMAPQAEIGWFDMYDKQGMAAVIAAAEKLKWLNSIYAGVDGMQLDLLANRGVVVTNGAGINARSEEHTSELQSLMRITYAVLCLKKKNN